MIKKRLIPTILSLVATLLFAFLTFAPVNPMSYPIPYMFHIGAVAFAVLSILLLRRWKRGKDIVQAQKKPKREIQPKEKKKGRFFGKEKQPKDEVVWLDTLQDEPEPYEIVDLNEDKNIIPIEAEDLPEDVSTKAEDDYQPDGTHCWKCGLAKIHWNTFHDKGECEHEELKNLKLSVPSQMKDLIRKLEEGLDE